jgi:hypothetical protein
MATDRIPPLPSPRWRPEYTTFVAVDGELFAVEVGRMDAATRLCPFRVRQVHGDPAPLGPLPREQLRGLPCTRAGDWWRRSG